MTRLAVTADPHCDDFGSKVDPATGLNARWQDSIDMLRWVALDARRRDADVLVVAGDLTEARHPAPWRVDMIRDAIADFAGPTVLLRGNHDGERNGRSIVDVLAAGRPGWHGFSRPGVTVVGDVAIAALPFLDRHWLRTRPGLENVPEADLLRVLAEQFLVVAGGLFVDASAMATRRVLVVHQGLSGGLMSDTQRAFLGDKSLVVDSRALGAIGFDAVLAGHFHLHQVISADPLIAYAGAPTRTDFGEEHQAKGYLIVDVEADGTTGITVPSWSFIETPARRFVTLHGYDEIPADVVLEGSVVRVVDLDPADDPARVRAHLQTFQPFDVTEIRRRALPSQESAGGLSESLTGEQALTEYFAGDPDAEALVDRGRAVLAEVA